MELALRVVVAVVLAWAALAKLLRLPRSAESLAEHGIPKRLRRPATIALAGVELGLAAFTAAGIFPRAAGGAIATLAAVFVAFLVRARLGGRRRTTCGCFGGARSANTIVLTGRAVILGAMGVGIATGVPAVPVSATTDAWQTIALVVLGGLVAVLTVAVLALYRQVGTLALRLGPRTALELEEEGPPLGQPAPLLPGLSRTGVELVAFISLDCRMCIEVVPGLRALERDGIPVHWIREDRDAATFERWGVPGTPFVVHVTDGVVRAKGLVNTLEQIDWVVDVGTERSRIAA